MFSPLRNRFGIPGVISVIALVFAMMGGAYAASNNGGGKASASAKAKRGPRGPKGATGPAGPAGLAGAAGAKGDKGDTGAAGSNGASATTETFAGAAHGCTAGGVIVKSASPEAIVCNGKNGTNGTTGFTSTLPPGKTETGVWALGPGPNGIRRVPISFSIPLAAELTGTQVHYINQAGAEVVAEGVTQTSTACLGSVTGPIATAGNLCIYTSFEIEALVDNELITKGDVDQTPGASIAGALMLFFNLGASGGGSGTWAVTAEE